MFSNIMPGVGLGSPFFRSFQTKGGVSGNCFRPFLAFFLAFFSMVSALGGFLYAR